MLERYSLYESLRRAHGAGASQVGSPASGGYGPARPESSSGLQYVHITASTCFHWSEAASTSCTMLPRRLSRMEATVCGGGSESREQNSGGYWPRWRGAFYCGPTHNKQNRGGFGATAGSMARWRSTPPRTIWCGVTNDGDLMTKEISSQCMPS